MLRTANFSTLCRRFRDFRSSTEYDYENGTVVWYAVAAAVLYGAHQTFTRLASDHIGDGLGGFLVEATAALSILLYLAILWFTGRWHQKFTASGFNFSMVTGICVGA